MHAFLIIGDNAEQLNKGVIDLVEKEGATQIPFTLQKIEDARELKKFVKFSFSTKTAIVISNIDKATNETLNAFLKNLEEPINNIVYILTASNITNVIPTILSRCQIITIKNKKLLIENIYADFLKQDIKGKLSFIDKIKDRGDAIRFVENIIHLKHQSNEFKDIQNGLNTLRNLKANGNVSLQLTSFVATMNPVYGR